MQSSRFEDNQNLSQYGPIPSNLHIHTPFSFSAFSDISQAVRLAREQGVLILGISDFNTTKGYERFTEECLRAKVFPSYGMEVMALSVEDQKMGKRWNDPNNPGRIYFCGKGFRYPVLKDPEVERLLDRIRGALDEQIRQMIDKLNGHLKHVVPRIYLDYDYILSNMTEGTVRERHIAKALQVAIWEMFPDIRDREMVLEDLCGKKVCSDDIATVQEELRSNLLKAGKVAFVEEKPSAYVSFEEAKKIMLSMHGIPCYPVLADGTKGKPTEFEADPSTLCDELMDKDVFCAEFIPTRNDISLLKDYVSTFKDKGMIMCVGTEHNTPRMEPMEPKCKDGVPLDEELKEIFWQGACIICAHQYLVSNGDEGYVDASGKRTKRSVQELESIGRRVIKRYLTGN